MIFSRRTCPNECENAAQHAREAGDYAAAARLERLGASVSLGHNRADRHAYRAKQDEKRAGSPPYEYATDADLEKYRISRQVPQEPSGLLR